LVLVLALATVSGESLGTFLRNVRFVVIFALVLFVAQALSIREGTTLFSVGVPITDQGLLAGAQMALRFLVILTSSFLFVLVTDPDRLAHTLIRLGIPYRYGFIFILALRFVPFFRRELRTVREAQRVRGIRTTVRNLAGLQRAIRYTFVPVLVSGLMRVDSIAMSMKGRCFGLYPRRTATRTERWVGADWAAAALFVLLVGVAVLARRQAWL
jgi:energy-coupling factor transport system permease protein